MTARTNANTQRRSAKGRSEAEANAAVRGCGALSLGFRLVIDLIIACHHQKNRTAVLARASFAQRLRIELRHAGVGDDNHDAMEALARARYEADGALVLLPIQSSSRNVGTKNGNTPYRVSLTECECRSAARNTVRQKMAASSHTIAPGTDTGT